MTSRPVIRVASDHLKGSFLNFSLVQEHRRCHRQEHLCSWEVSFVCEGKHAARNPLEAAMPLIFRAPHQ